MSSILANVGAIESLQSRSSTNQSLPTRLNRINSGLHGESAKDSAFPGAAPKVMRGDASGFKSISEKLALSLATISVARQAADSVADLLNAIKVKIALANSSSGDTAEIQAAIDQLAEQMTSVVNAAQFDGVSLLAPGGSVEMLASLDRSGAAVTVSNINFTEIDLSAATLAIDSIDVTTAANASTAIDTIEAAIATAVDAAAQFGSLQNRLGIQDEFVKALTDALSEGVGILVDTNMEEEAARLNALQAQQQLGVQSLSIANSVPHSILALFR